MMGLVALHVGAALKHHFIDRDDVLARMIPMLSRKRPRA
jgi:cytochrome b561